MQCLNKCNVRINHVFWIRGWCTTHTHTHTLKLKSIKPSPIVIARNMEKMKSPESSCSSYYYKLEVQNKYKG